MLFQLLLAVLLPLQAPAITTIAGTVRDATGLPLPGASVEVDGKLVAVSGTDGAFQMSLPAGMRPVVAISLPGFQSFRTTLDAQSSRALDVVLQIAGVEDRILVRAPPPELEVGRAFTLTPIQIYRTPGAQGDILRALHTLPGVSSPDEGTGLFVRGGDVSEVLVTLDDAAIAHPYRYETPTGGFRGAVDPFQIAGLAFTTGGFAARYGNVLSGVVDLRGLEQPQVTEAAATVGLAGVSASIARPLGRRGGVRGAFNRTFTSLLFAVNGSPRRFDPAPEGWDASASAAWNLGSAGRLKVLALVQRDVVGVEMEQDAFIGLLRSSSRHQFVNARWDGAVRSWAGSVSVGSDLYERQTAAGILDLATDDAVRSWRVEAARSRLLGATWRIGGNGGFTSTTVRGIAPLRGGDLGGVSGLTAFDAQTHDWFGGAYLDVTTSAGPVAVTPGLRVDRFGHAHATTADPRVNARVALFGYGALRFATGIYRQAPSVLYFDRTRGAARLPPMRAVHYVAGYEAGREVEGGYIRVEGYRKDYRNLPLESVQQGYSAEGYGWAHGVDLFAQHLSERIELRVSASWLRAERRWTPAAQRERYDVPEGTWSPDFEVPWSTQLSATVPLAANRSIGASWRSAAGRPHTPVVGAVRLGDRFAPVFGALNSERLPRYERLDLSFNWLVPAGRGVAIVFVSADNVLGRANAREYVYATDYSSRRLATSASPRSFYAGFSFRR